MEGNYDFFFFDLYKDTQSMHLYEIPQPINFNRRLSPSIKNLNHDHQYENTNHLPIMNFIHFQYPRKHLKFHKLNLEFILIFSFFHTN